MNFSSLSVVACIGLLLSGCVPAPVPKSENSPKERYRGAIPWNFSTYSKLCHDVLLKDSRDVKIQGLYRNCVSEKTYYQGIYKLCADRVDFYSTDPITTAHSAQKGKAFSFCLINSLRKPLYD